MTFEFETASSSVATAIEPAVDIVDAINGCTQAKNEIPFLPNVDTANDLVAFDFQQSLHLADETQAVETIDASDASTWRGQSEDFLDLYFGEEDDCRWARAIAEANLEASQTDEDRAYWQSIVKWQNDCADVRLERTIKINKLKEQQNIAAIEMKRRQDSYKEARDAHKDILDKLLEATDDKSYPPIPTRPSLSNCPAGDQPSALKSSGESPENEAWRSISTAETIENIKGLGTKKKEAIIDEYPTLGLLEDLRGEASKQHKHFCKLLPKGIGEKMADEIAEAMFQAMKGKW